VKIISGRFDGGADLPDVAKQLGFASVVELVLDRCVFPPASIVRETNARPIVNTVRAGMFDGHGKVARGEYVAPAVAARLWGMRCTQPQARGVLADDNMSPHFAFSSCFTVRRDRIAISTTQLCHIFDSAYSKDPRFFSSLANLVLVPWWLAKLTDVDADVCQALRFVARAGFGACPTCHGKAGGCTACSKPEALTIDESGAKELVARYEPYRVDNYEATARSVRDARWQTAISAGIGYAEPVLGS